MKLGTIKLKNIVDVQLKSEELELLKGGDFPYACSSGACTSSAGLVENYCRQGSGICKSMLVSSNG